jgi:hypothetical protein
MKVCFVGFGNLPVLAREYNHHGNGGAQLQQTLLAEALVARGYQVFMVVEDYGQSDAAAWHGVTTYKADSLLVVTPRYAHRVKKFAPRPPTPRAFSTLLTTQWGRHCSPGAPWSGLRTSIHIANC